MGSSFHHLQTHHSVSLSFSFVCLFHISFSLPRFPRSLLILYFSCSFNLTPCVFLHLKSGWKLAKDEQKTKLSVEKDNPSEDSRRQKKSPEAEPSGCWFVEEPDLAAEARKRWPERYKNNKVSNALLPRRRRFRQISLINDN